MHLINNSEGKNPPISTHYRMCWRHKDFPDHSKGPVLRHSLKGTTTTGRPYTKNAAEIICKKFNKHCRTFTGKDKMGKNIKVPFVTHWVEEVPR